jgi:hypothetical protein
MSIVHDVEIIWDDLLDAFSGGRGDRIYFLDRQSGEIFFVPSAFEDDDFWRQIEINQDRFLEIPSFDYSVERKIMSGFINAIGDPDLKRLLDGSLNSNMLHGNIDDILSFFPGEQVRLQEIKDEFLTSRVKHWLEENNLFTGETEALLASRI